ncbi:MAG: hypothetical protein ACOYXT_13200 [Bacteroidota bacterium]
MSNFLYIIPNQKKAGIFVCLFLFLIIGARAQQWVFDKNSQEAYDLVLNLQLDEARQLLPEPRTAQDHYVLSLADALELLITEDAEKFTEYEDHFQSRLDKKIKSSDADYQFLQAELRLQWAFVYLKYGHEFDAALNLRQAYQIAETCKDKTPKYLAIKKTTALLEIIVGSVPEKYNWVLGLLGMQGAIQVGLSDFESVRHSSSPVNFEADLLYALVQGFIFQNTDSAVVELKKLQAARPNNRLALFLGASLAIKNSQSEDALKMLTTLESSHSGLPLYYADYLRGEVYLHKADYLNAISAYRWFIGHYKGQNYIKDATYKIGLCYWLNGNVNDAHDVFEDARNKGKEASEADKHAARSMAEAELPNVKLSKTRFFTDGGYYAEAQQQLESISPADIPTKRDQVEFYYRKARLAHKTSQLPAAKMFYQQTIDMAGEEHWYFAPNACLQMGYILLAEKDHGNAENYFEKALRYKRHEYKNSIDSKAKSALAQMKRK